MKNLLLVVVALVTLSLAQNPPRPQVSEVFSATLKVEVKERERTLHGEGVYFVNQPKGLGLERYSFQGHPTYDHHLLQRYDLNHTYFIGSPSNHSHCESHSVEGPMPAIWGWISQATYQGRKHYHDVEYDVWQYTQGYASLWIAVTPKDPNTPVWTGRNSTHREVNHHYMHWSTKTPDPDHFHVPHQCEQAQLSRRIASRSQCVARSTMISRGQVWVDNHVPYNQGGTYQGYREDCSGYVSMCWELSKPGYTTFTLPQVSHEISKGDLQSGDVLLDTSEHVVLFRGWADSGHTQYTSMEETRPGEGTVERVTPYPYWYNQAAFIPYRYNHVC
jgi:hypothetical protein